jgi:uncharacterized membrane protein YdjX (TVP38/TMEM64 family)
VKELKKVLFLTIGLGGLIGLIYFSKPQWFENVMEIFSTGAVDSFVEYIQSFGLWAPVISILLMIVQALAAPLPAFLIAGANGIVFGIGWGSLISWLGGMAGALVSFWLARLLGRDFVSRMTKGKARLGKVDEMSTDHGFKIILVARLLPFISFDLMSYLAGLSKMKIRSFLLATGVGMIPGTVLYTALGHDLLQAQTYSNRLLVVIGIIGLLYAVGKYKRWSEQKRKSKQVGAEAEPQRDLE